MILVLLGTQNNSFHRLLEEIDNLIQNGTIKEQVIVQAGYTKYETPNMKQFDLIDSEELEKLLNQARIVITHGGVGSIISSIKKGKKVIAVPRLHEYGEHVNNHQKQIVELFAQKRYIIGALDVKDLEKSLLEVEKFKPVKFQQNNDKMLKIISNFIDTV